MRRTFLRSQWIQVGGYNPGMPAYQEGGFWNTLAAPAMSYVGQLATNVGHDTACRAARQFYKSHCREEEEPPRKKKKKGQRSKKTQNGRGGDKYDSGTPDYQEGGLVLPFSAMTYEQWLRAQRGQGSGRRPRRRTPRRPRNITAASLDADLYRRLGGRPIGVLPSAIPGFQMGMGGNQKRAGNKRRRTGRGDCFNILL